MAPSPIEKDLTDLLQALSDSSSPATPATGVHLVARSLLPSSPKSERSLAYLCLSKLVEDGSRLGEGRDAQLIQTFRPIIDIFSQEDAPGGDGRFLPPTILITSLFPLAPAVASALLTTPLSQESDAPDPLAVLLEVAELEAGGVQLALAELCVAAAGTKPGREFVQSRAGEWLRGCLTYGGSSRVGGVAAAALAKLGMWSKPTEDGLSETADESDPARLIDLMRTSLQGNSDVSATSAIVEGLAIMSTRPATKAYLAESPILPDLLQRLPSKTARNGSLPITAGRNTSLPDPASSEPTDTSLCYGIATILVNISSRKPVLSAEDEQMAKLRAMGASGMKGGGPGSDPLDEAPAVQKRVRGLYDIGVVSYLHRIALSESLLVKQLLGRLCLNLVEDKERRMGFIKDGGFKTLSETIRRLMDAYTGKTDPAAISVNTPSPADIDILPAVQAAAKLLITTPPHLLFPPPHHTTSLNALMPMYILLTHPSATLLQTFEALMGLTNLASISPDLADRIVSAEVTPRGQDGMWQSNPSSSVRIIGKVEEMMMDDNDLIRRASTELLCNLAGSEKGFGYLSGETEGGVRAKQRVHLLSILTDVDDLATRLAAGGALAIISESPIACRAILEEGTGRSAWKRLVALLEPEEVEEEGEKIALISTSPPDEGLILRAVCVLVNLLQYAEGLDGEEKRKAMGKAKEDGVEGALRGVLGMKVGEAVLRPAVECLQILKRAG